MENNLANTVSPTEMYNHKDQLKYTMISTPATRYMATPWKWWTAVNILESPSMKTLPEESILTTQRTRPTRHLDLSDVLRNLSDCSAPVKSAAYTTMVRPRLEYSSTVWDLHLNRDIHNLEQVQCRAARFVNRNYTEPTPACVTNMVQNLGWESLQHRRYINRLAMLFIVQDPAWHH